MIVLPLLFVGTALLGNLQSPLARHVSRMTGGALEVVSSTPGAWVRVDGDMLGRTPVRVAGLTPGAHRVEVAGAGLDVQVEDGLLTQLSASPSGLQITTVLTQATPAAAPAHEAARAFVPD